MSITRWESKLNQYNGLLLKNTPTASLQKSEAHPNECAGYGIKQSDGEAPVVLELWGMQSTSSLPDPLRPGVVTPDRILSMGQIEQTVGKQMTDVKL